ncbi:DUF429 domain-containing protein [Kineococcus sp. TRM81007]|uniref:DUF429 domain-containing protein n=1 Tax=Kineococcus sp. TRM81007 TaxID=2925831 RepID=UPI001F5A580B|nr:DUF429 domain-containing protein [Kineococcus sp. TRM81007]MCI2238685.1 DUF429 domain-containing protein [Kineococcus sp. TRM81007]
MTSTVHPEDEGCFVGIDLGWVENSPTGRTGLAAVDGSGRLLACDRVKRDEEIAAWLDAQPGRLVVAAVDAPLVVPNATGSRPAEKLVGTHFGSFGASAYPSNHRLVGERPRAQGLAERFSWAVDPSTPTGGAQGVCIEVYPHPAMIGLFALNYRLDYKKGGTERRAPAFAELARHLESIAVLQLAEHPRWQQIRQTIAAPGPGDLNRIEDEMDAVLCAHLAWLWHHQPQALHVYGNVDEGYIVAPPPPSHRPVRPASEQRPPTPSSRRHSFRRVVVGRPTGFTGERNEQEWKRAVASAFTGCVLPADARVQVEVDFLLGPGQSGNDEPDLDNLLKSTIDALVDVIGARPLKGPRQADDVRVDRIVATKRFASDGEPAGADVRVSALA